MKRMLQYVPTILILGAVLALSACGGQFDLFGNGRMAELEDRQDVLETQQSVVETVLENAKKTLADAEAALANSTDPEANAETEALIAELKGIIDKLEGQYGNLAVSLENTIKEIANAETPADAAGAAGTGLQGLSTTFPPPWNLIVWGLGTLGVAYETRRRTKNTGDRLVAGVMESFDKAKVGVAHESDGNGGTVERLKIDVERLKEIQRELGLKRKIDDIRDGTRAAA